MQRACPPTAQHPYTVHHRGTPYPTKPTQRLATGPPAPVIPTQARNQQRNQQGSERNQAIRDWARQRHIIVSTTGRIPEQLKRVYDQEVHI